MAQSIWYRLFALACDSAVGLTGFFTAAGCVGAAACAGARAVEGAAVCGLRPCNGNETTANADAAKSRSDDFDMNASSIDVNTHTFLTSTGIYRGIIGRLSGNGYGGGT
jgi:hypothetical protein